MSTPDPEELAARILGGELSEDSPEVQEAFARDPELHGRLAEMRSLEELLAVEAEEVEGARLWSEEATSTPDPTPAPPVRRKPRVLSLVLTVLSAAAALLLIFQLAGEDTPKKRIGEGITLGTGPGESGALEQEFYSGSGSIELTILSPLGPIEGPYTFAFETPEEGPFSVDISVWSKDAPEDAKPLLANRIEGRSWTLTPAQDAQLPAEIRWSIRVEDRNKNTVWGGKARASR